MVRTNGKQQVISYENSIQKSNEISMAKLSQGLTLNQMQLLAYAIYSTQQDGKTEFIKADFEKKFGLVDYKTSHAKEDVKKISILQFSIEDLENDYFEYWNVFGSIKYNKGTFTFRWNEEFIPHILELKEKYVTTDLRITSKFRSSFSWTLYDYLRAHYGYWHKPISKEALMKLFGVENTKSYQSNTGVFKQKVLDVAINEINQYTELEVGYNVQREGRAIVGFDLIWSNGNQQKSATKKQIKELKLTIDTVFEDVFKFVDIDIKERRQRAIQIIDEMKAMKPYTEEPIAITSEFADKQLEKASDYLRELNALLTIKDKRDTSFYYNWLED